MQKVCVSWCGLYGKGGNFCRHYDFRRIRPMVGGKEGSAVTPHVAGWSISLNMSYADRITLARLASILNTPIRLPWDNLFRRETGHDRAGMADPRPARTAAT
jgi:hypothetical protein